jgi:hypothetical protein
LAQQQLTVLIELPQLHLILVEIHQQIETLQLYLIRKQLQ